MVWGLIIRVQDPARLYRVEAHVGLEHEHGAVERGVGGGALVRCQKIL